MNHLEASFTGRNSLWRYIVMIVAIMLATNTVGAFPIILAGVLKSVSDPSAFSRFAANPNDLSTLGLDPISGLAMMIFPFMIGLLAFALLVRPLNNRSFKITLNGTDKIRWDRFFISALVWLIISGLYLFVYLKIDPANFRLNNLSSSLIALSLVTILMIPFQAGFEEVLFRGYLMQGFAAFSKNRWLPLIFTSVAFGLMHSFNPEVKEYGFLQMMPQYVLFGLIFGIITILDDGIEASMGAHAANNIFLCIAVTSKSSALSTPAVYEQLNVSPWFELAGLAVSGVIFVLVLRKIFRWQSFGILSGKVEKPALPQDTTQVIY